MSLCSDCKFILQDMWLSTIVICITTSESENWQKNLVINLALFTTSWIENWWTNLIKVRLALQQDPQNAQSTWLTQQKYFATITEFPQFSDQVLTMQLIWDYWTTSIQNDKPGIRISFNLPGSFGLGTFDLLFAGLFKPMIAKHSVVLNQCTCKINIELKWGQIIVGNACTAAEILIS